MPTNPLCLVCGTETTEREIRRGGCEILYACPKCAPPGSVEERLAELEERVGSLERERERDLEYEREIQASKDR